VFFSRITFLRSFVKICEIKSWKGGRIHIYRGGLITLRDGKSLVVSGRCVKIFISRIGALQTRFDNNIATYLVCVTIDWVCIDQ
jgi:hypothetical protein